MITQDLLRDLMVNNTDEGFLTSTGSTVVCISTSEAFTYIEDGDTAFDGVDWIAFPMKHAKRLATFLRSVEDCIAIDSGAFWSGIGSLYGADVTKAFSDLIRETNDKNAVIMKRPSSEYKSEAALDPYYNIFYVGVEPFVTQTTIDATRDFAILTKTSANLLISTLESIKEDIGNMPFVAVTALNALKMYMSGKFIDMHGVANIEILFANNPATKKYGSIYTTPYNRFMKNKSKSV